MRLIAERVTVPNGTGSETMVQDELTSKVYEFVAPELTAASSLGAIDVIAVRLWLNATVRRSAWSAEHKPGSGSISERHIGTHSKLAVAP